MDKQTQVLADALWILSREIESGDGVANTVVAQGAHKIEELSKVIDSQAATIAKLQLDADPQALTIAYMQGHMDGRASRPINPTEN